MKKFIY